MSRLYVVGGQQKSDALKKEEWHSCKYGVILQVDEDTGKISESVRYVSPPETCPDEDPSILFKAGTLVGQELYACTQTEVLIYRLPQFELVRHVSHPWFNDVHHVHPNPNGNLIVANTGLDMAQEVALDGTAVREWNVAPEETWTRFSRDVDYRKVPTTKPHLSHPNHVCFIEGELWVTRCSFQDVVCVTRPQLQPIRLITDYVSVHDGRVCDGLVYFTAVDGRVIVVSAESREVVREIRLEELARGRGPLGWCRGIELLDDDRLVVGFSRLRPTKFVENLWWVKHALGGTDMGLCPTSLMAIDLKNSRMLWHRSLEPHTSAVFSIHLAP